jgi:phenylacetate-coenzyme A ligase PaaK-like adenylate-forming protein
VLFEVPGLIDYRVEVTRRGNKDCLDFKIEMTAGSRDKIPEISRKLASAPIIARNLASGLMAEPGIEIAGRGTLQAEARAKRRILDHRQGGAGILDEAATNSLSR